MLFYSVFVATIFCASLGAAMGKRVYRRQIAIEKGTATAPRPASYVWSGRVLMYGGLLLLALWIVLAILNKTSGLPTALAWLRS